MHEDAVTAKAKKDPTSLGCILISLGYATQEEIDQILLEDEGRRIGEALVERGCLTSEQLEAAMLKQSIMRGAVDKRDGIKTLFAQSKRLTGEVTAGFHNVARLSTTLRGRIIEEK